MRKQRTVRKTQPAASCSVAASDDAINLPTEEQKSAAASASTIDNSSLPMECQMQSPTQLLVSSPVPTTVVTSSEDLSVVNGPPSQVMADKMHVLALNQALYEFQQTGYLCDTIVVARDGQLNAHSAVLAAASPLFKALLLPSDKPIERTILLPGVPLWILQITIRVAYTGQLIANQKQLSADSIPSVVAAVQAMGIKLDGCVFSVVVDDVSESGKEKHTSSSTNDKTSELKTHSYDGGDKTHHGDSVETDTWKVPTTCKNAVGVTACAVEHERVRNEKNIDELLLPSFVSDAVCDAVDDDDDDDDEASGVLEHSSISVSDSLILQPGTSLQQQHDGRVSNLLQKSSCNNSRRQSFDLNLRNNSKQTTVHIHKLSESTIKDWVQQSKTLEYKRLEKPMQELKSKTSDSEHKETDKQTKSNIKHRSLLPKVMCEFCGRMIAARTQKIHLLSHRPAERPHACHICGSRFAVKGNLKRHVKSHAGGKAFVCEICGESYNKQKSLLNHRSVFHLSDADRERELKCVQCSIQFGCYMHLQRHISSGHTRTTFPAVRSQLMIRSHIAYDCLECDAKFSETKMLVAHAKTVHNCDKPYVCVTCNERFESRPSLTIHRDRAHRSLHMFGCPHCPMSFRLRTEQHKHKLEHGLDKSLRCSICSKPFMWKKALDDHEITHAGHGPYICPMCSRQMPTSWHLKEHLMSHSEERPHKCELCGSSYKHRLTLLKHRAQKHNIRARQVKLKDNDIGDNGTLNSELTGVKLQNSH